MVEEEGGGRDISGRGWYWREGQEVLVVFEVMYADM